MKIARRLMPSAVCLLAATPLAQAGDDVFSGTVAPPAGVELTLPSGWVAGSSSTVLDSAQASLRQPGAVSRDARASELHAGYRSTAGSLDYSAVLRMASYPGLRPGSSEFGNGTAEHGELSAGVGWRDLSARYDYAFTQDYLGLPDARGSHYLDIGARHAFDRSTWLHVHAGDGRIAGAGNALWDWRDLRAGFTRKLEDGWTMALNYRRVYGNATVAERYGRMPRAEGLIPSLGRGHRGLVLSLNRGF